MNNYTDHVTSLLQNYRTTKRKIEQLRYELEHPTRVTPDEMIEAMNFAKGDGEGRPSGSVSNKTLYIAMNFQSAADEANASLTHDLVSRLVPLEQEIGKRLRFMGITLIQVFFYSPGGRKRQVYVTMHTKRKICVPVKKVAAVLSELTDCEMMPARDSRTFVSQEKVTVLFVEATAYQVLYGIKKVTKPGEAVSGDNFSVFWLPEGRFVAGLSDGMGSGLQACGQSETVLDLMEQFLEAGFSRETAVRMINSSIVLQPEPHIFSTVDLASIDLYTGICEFLKIGSAASFIRRERNVECIRGTGLPAGISSELPLDPYRVRIYDGNLLFLMTDGVLGALPEGQEEAVMKDLIWNLPPGTPSEMAARLMEQVQTYGKAADDMTILVVGIWKR